ncbi:hypothetical protein PHLCEN_2v5234 [Hermanssonia centrifuga]|uniref:Uncharacterized protein n=1 Tax=Hermanssonia centrifuga TaxID=98765 RepID=A0A2R6P968_9APHY|nr:hypothetical protein PHLCEN_2v5234 [Hermanssonia centrifuga]
MSATNDSNTLDNLIAQNAAWAEANATSLPNPQSPKVRTERSMHMLGEFTPMHHLDSVDWLL